MKHLSSAALAFAQRLKRRFRIAEWQTLLFWSIPAGLLGALATELFGIGLAWLDRVALGRSGNLVDIAESLPGWARIAAPTVGGLLAGLLLVSARRVSAKKAVSDYMEAIVVGNGRIPVAQTLFRSASSLVTIASGASIGREGSMVQLAALGTSLLGRLFRFPVDRLRLLVACGAAAGLTAAYSAPIAGAFFVAEIVLGSIAMESVGPIMVASVVANITMRQFAGYQPPYEMPTFPTVSGVEVLLFAVMGVLLGGASALFLAGLRASRRLFARLPVPLPVRLALGGLIVGVISTQLPEVWGNGYSVVNSVLHSSRAWEALWVLLLAKAVATLATAGSGAVGGVFTPALFFGCIVGALFGQAVHVGWPAATAAPFAYAIVGMGAFLAGATQAPLMAILMIFEMTLSYQVMLPLMVASVIAYFVARSASTQSMYDITVHRQMELDERVRLRGLHMRDLIEPAHTVVGLDADVESMSRLFLQFPVKYLYVTDSEACLLGVVPLRSLRTANEAGMSASLRAVDLMIQEIAPISSDMTLSQALERFMAHRGERLPVIDSADRPTLLGVVSKSRLLATYVRMSQ